MGAFFGEKSPSYRRINTVVKIVLTGNLRWPSSCLYLLYFPAVYIYKIMILQKNHLTNFHQISHWSFCWNVIDSLFKWSCTIDCQAHIFFFKTKNCSNGDIFISCDDRIGKMLHNICMSAVAISLRWASRGPWASCLFLANSYSLTSDQLSWNLIYS